MIVFHNGRFFSCDEENETFQVLIADQGRIVYTGNEIPSGYQSAEKVDLNGCFVTPCFGDTHFHFTSTCFLPLDVRGTKNIPEVLELIRKYAENNRQKAMTVFGISAHTMAEKRLPLKSELDLATRKPLALAKYDGHAAILNSALIDMLPQEIKNHPQMNLETGECYSEAFQLLSDYSAAAGFVTPSFVMENVPRVMNHLASLGINLVMPVEGFEDDSSPYDLTRAIDGQTPIRVLPFLQTMKVADAVIKKCPRIGGCFANQLDGCFGAEDAALREPYTNRPESKGWLLYDQETVNDFLIKANRAGMQIAIHAIGDAAIEQLILGFEAALEDYPRPDHRHAIIHGDLFPKEYLEKAGKLGLYCALQTPFLTWPEEPLEYLVELIGKRAYEKHPLPLMIKAGITLANGSDNPSSLANPLMGLYACCNHPNPNYRIDIATALKMQTINAAKFAFLENEMGSLTVGKVADFVVFDRDLCAIPPDTILDAKIIAVYFGGKPYQTPFTIKKSALVGSVIKGKINFFLHKGKGKQ